MEIRKALVTGPTGCVGTALVRKLLEMGVQVTAVIRPESPLSGNLPVSDRLKTVSCDLSELSSLPSFLSPDYDVFFHLGWSGTYGDDRRDREKQRMNAVYTEKAVEASKGLGVKVFVFAGSQSEFGPVDGIMTPETPCHPDNPYGEAKLLAEKSAKEKCAAYGIRFEACRILSAYGPCDKPYTMVMSTLRRMLTGERLSFTKGEQIWDYIYSDDAAAALLSAAMRGKDGSIYLIASGKSGPLKDFITKMRDAVDPSLPLYFGEIPYYEHQVMRMEADISALREDTGFEPAVPFEEGIRRTLKWLRERETF